MNPLLTLLLEHGAQVLIVYDTTLKTDDRLFLLFSWCLDTLLDLGSPSVSRGKVTIDIGASLARITMNGLNVEFFGRRKQQSMRLPQRELNKGKLVWVSLL